jgi:cell division protein FtsA
MFDWLKRKPQEKTMVALDIGTENAKALVFSIEEKQSMAGEVTGRRAVVKGVGKSALRPGDIQNSGITDIASVIRSTKEAIRLASQEAGRQPSQLVLGIAGEFVKGATSKLVFPREDPQSKINLAELRNIVHKLQWKAFAEVRKALGDETGYPEIDIKLIESSIVEVRIDKYKVSNPLGFQGKEVEMSIFNAFAPLGHYDALQNIAEELGLELLGIVSEPFALSRCVESEEGNSAIYIDVGGGSTDIAVVSGGSIMGTRIFGIGGRTFTKRLSVELNISFEEAEKLKWAYTSDRVEQKSKKIIGDIINDDMEVWLEGVVLALSEFKSETMPPKILLSGGGTHLSEFKTLLNSTKWYKKLPFARTPQALMMNPKEIVGIIDETKKIRERDDIVPMALVNEGIKLSGEETIVQKVLRKVIGIMKV